MVTQDTGMDTKVAVNRALQILGEFRKIDPEMNMGAAVSFLLIAGGETPDGRGISITELAKQGSFAPSSASRYVQALGELDRHQRPGYFLVEDKVDMTNRRRKVLRLTANGWRILSTLTTLTGVK